MAQITLDIPAPVTNRVLDAIAANNNYNAGTDGTKAQFAKVQLVKFLKAQVAQFEGKSAARAAETAANLSVESDIAIT